MAKMFLRQQSKRLLKITGANNLVPSFISKYRGHKCDYRSTELEVLYIVAERWVDIIRAAREKERELKIVAQKEHDEIELEGPELDL